MEEINSGSDVELELDFATVYQAHGKPISSQSPSKPSIPDSERPCYRMAVKDVCTEKDCPYSHDPAVLEAYYQEKARAFAAKRKSGRNLGSNSSQHKTILSRPLQNQKQLQNQRSKLQVVDGKGENLPDESSSRLVTSARANRSGNGFARGSDEDEF